MATGGTGLLQRVRARRLTARATRLLRGKHYEKALILCERALAINPNSPAAWIRKSWALLALQRNEDALPACERVIALNPRHAWAWRNKGLALLRVFR